MKDDKELLYLKNEIRKLEIPDRYDHTVGVASECRKLSEAFGLSEIDAYALDKAAILHDITKCFDGQKQIELCREFGIPEPPKASDPMPTVHQDTGAYYAKKKFGDKIVTDTVFSAISCHTTGKENMTVPDKILFLADFIEPARKYKSCTEIREYLYSECGKINKNDKAALMRLLDSVVIDSIGFTISYLISKKRKIDARMISAWNSLLCNAAFV